MIVYIKSDSVYFPPIYYLLKLIEKNKNIQFTFTGQPENAELIFDHTNNKSQPLALSFYNSLQSENSVFFHDNYFPDEQLIKTQTDVVDYMATIFYMINCLQEFNPRKKDVDLFGRFRYVSSYQKRFESIEKNLAQGYIDFLIKSWNITDAKNFKSGFFLSHDIDNIYGSLLQDGFWALKKGKIDAILRIIANEFIRKPHWRNIDKIIRMDSEYDIKSTFFWLVNKGRGDLNIKNADYSISKEKELLQIVRKNGFVNGLHKSCSPMNINDELTKLSADSYSNRYHFLKFLPHIDWVKINHSKIKFDSSLGFAERYGFRNSFGMPFQPYNLSENKPFEFIEAPMNFMDGTFHKYMKLSCEVVTDRIINFYESNNKNCIFSLCWHNTYFTNYKYKGFIEQYKKLLTYIHESKIECYTPDEIINKFKIS